MNKSDDYQASRPRPVLPSAFSLFGTSWQAVRLNIVPIIEFTLIPILVNIGVFLLLRQPGESSFLDSYRLSADQLNFGTGYLVSTGATGLITLLLMPAVTLTYLNSVKGKKTGLWQAIKDSLPFWWRYIGLMLLYGLAVLGGFILLIIPGIIILQRYFLAGYFLIDKNLSIRDALKTSWQTTKLYSGPVWGLLGVILLIEVLVGSLGSNYLFQIAGELIILIYSCAPAVRYLQIKQAEKELA